MSESHNNLFSRLTRGLGAQGFQQAVQLFIRLAEVPLLLGFWGTQLYGEWLMLSAIPAYLSIGDGGFATAACRDMAMKSGAGDRNGVLAVFQSTWLLLIAVSVATGAVAYAFVEVAPLGDWLGFSVMKDGEIKIVLFLLVAHVLVGFQGGLLNGGFWVTGCYPRGMYLQATTQLLEFVGLAIAVSLEGGPVQAATGFVAGKLLGTGVMWLGQLRVCPWLRFGVSQSSFSELRRLAAPAFASLAFPLGNAFNIQGMRIVVGLVLGPASVAVFSPLRTLSNLALQPQAIIYRLVEPELALAFGSKAISLFRRLFARACQLALWGCLVACLLIGLGAYWILPAWTSGKVAMHWPTYLLLLSGVLLRSVWGTANLVPYATNRHGRIAMFYAPIYGVAALGLAFLLAIRFGLGGAALALVLTEAAMVVIVIRISLRMADIRMALWLKKVLMPPFDILGQVGGLLRKRVMVPPQ